jgi:hypothetical protein
MCLTRGAALDRYVIIHTLDPKHSHPGHNESEFLRAVPRILSGLTHLKRSAFDTNSYRWGNIPMFDAETTALLRAVLDEVCEGVSRREIGARTHVASKILEAATRGETSVDSLKQVGQRALRDAPTMWR